MDQVAQVREKIDIVSFISEYIPLKKMGRNFKALCPFHSEKTPSFVVSPERQIWHCFGCNLGGDCFTFLMSYEKLEFPEALRILAKKAGVELAQFRFESGVSSEKEKLYALNHLVSEFYHYLLTKHNVGKKALLYLTEKRGIKMPVITTFKLGFAPGIGNALCGYLLKKKGYKKDELFKAGLTIQKGGDILDFFQNRIMFPLFDHRDNVVGFSGRSLFDSPSAGGSKYINTKETLAYQKGSHFFGLNISKQEIKKEARAIITEGEFDVMSLFQEGIGNTVAVKGSGLTENQVNLLSRFTQKVSLCFDQDSAGQEAIKRSLSFLEQRGLTTTVIEIPNGKDPDEAVKKDPVSFKKALKHDLGIYDFLLAKLKSLYDPKTADGKRKISDELLPFLFNIQNEIVKEHYLKKLSLELDVSYDSVLRQAEKTKTKESSKISSKALENPQKTREEVLEEYLLSLILQAEEVFDIFTKAKNILDDFEFSQPSYQKIFEHLLFYFDNNNTFDQKMFLKTLPQELLSAFDTCFLLPLPKFQTLDKYKEEAQKIAKELRVLYLKSKIKLISEEIKSKEKEEDMEQLETLKKEFSSLVSLLSR
ncbi:MAG: DNA primase [bacterium]|nr:DNA primase [bacterium]